MFKRYLLLGSFSLAVLLSSPAKATIDSYELLLSIGSDIEMVLEGIEEYIGGSIVKDSGKVSGYEGKGKEIEMETGKSCTASDETVGCVDKEVASLLEQDKPSAKAVKERYSTTLLLDRTTPETTAATAQNAKNQLFVSSAQGVALGVDAQTSSIEEGFAAADSIHEKAGASDNYTDMHRHAAVSVLQMIEKINAIGTLHTQILEVNSSGYLVGQEAEEDL